MTEALPSKPPTWFWIVAGLALIWNLMGVFAFIGQASIDESQLAAMAANERALYENIPAWATAAFAIAVFGGALGCLLLLLRRSLALQVLIASLAAVIVQMAYNFFVSGAMDVYGPGGMIMPVMVIIISTGLVFFTRHARTAGWLR